MDTSYQSEFDDLRSDTGLIATRKELLLNLHLMLVLYPRGKDESTHRRRFVDSAFSEFDVTCVLRLLIDKTRHFRRSVNLLAMSGLANPTGGSGSVNENTWAFMHDVR